MLRTAGIVAGAAAVLVIGAAPAFADGAEVANLGKCQVLYVPNQAPGINKGVGPWHIVYLPTGETIYGKSLPDPPFFAMEACS